MDHKHFVAPNKCFFLNMYTRHYMGLSHKFEARSVIESVLEWKGAQKVLPASEALLDLYRFYCSICSIGHLIYW